METPSSKSEGRPYRSHLHPACFSCRKRKSRCKTRDASEICIMCQAHGTECIFPHPDDPYHGRQPNSPRKSPANARYSRRVQARHGGLNPKSQLQSHVMPQAVFPNDSQIVHCLYTPGNPIEDAQISPSCSDANQAEGPPHLMDIATETGNDSSHVISPAVADDNEILESYLSTIPLARKRRLVRQSTSSTQPARPVRFNTVPRRPLGVTANQTLAASKCEVVEKYMEPFIDEYLGL